MLHFIVKRLLSGFVLLVVISFVAYVLLHLSGEDIARRILGDLASQEAVAQRTRDLGLDQPLLVQYSDWLFRALHGDLGRSWFSGELVSKSVATRLGVTLSLSIGATVLAAALAVVLGIFAARRGGWIDSAVQFVVLLGFALPGFLVALLLVTVFAVGLGWFRATGYVAPDVSLLGWLRSITLPVVAMSLSAIAAVAQQVRGSVLDALSRDYVRTLRARGLPTRSVVYRHVLRNAGGPALAILALQFIGLLGGTIIIEQLFAIPGMGQLTVKATVQGDIPVVMGLTIIFVIVVLLVNIIIDIAQAAINPRIRLS